jgi:hypothetical protein
MEILIVVGVGAVDIVVVVMDTVVDFEVKVNLKM